MSSWDTKELVAIAKSYQGREFNHGAIEQCMAFVRHCLKKANCPIADKVTKKAVDGLDTDFFLASSLAGRDLGFELVGLDKMSLGSVVFFNDTYEGWWSGRGEATITHVGIYIGSGLFVHRPTSERPVEVGDLANSWHKSHLRCGLDFMRPTDKSLPVTPVVPSDTKRLKIYSHSGKVRVLSNGEEVSATEVKIFVNSAGGLGVVVNGKSVDDIGMSFDFAYKEKKQN